MCRFIRLALLASLALVLQVMPVRAAYRVLQAPAADDPLKTHIYRLDNGLTVYLTANHQEPRFHAEIVVRAGSKDDPDDLTGMAHYMEHMFFKGTSRIGTADFAAEKPHLDRIQALYEQRFATTDSARRADLYAQINQEAQRAARYAIPNELDRLYTAMGARGLNASTSYEFIQYRVDLPANRLRQWARIEAERFRDPVFRLFQTELETVYEEMNMREIDNKDAILRNAVNALLYRRHPYGRPVIGTIADLHNPSLSHMYAFYHKYYVPANMAVILSGDVQPDSAIQVIDSEFSIWPKGRIPRPRHWKEPRIRQVRRDTVYYPGEESVLIAFRTQPSTHEDTEALQVLDMILDNAVAGLININLNQQQRVREAGSYTTSHGVSNDYGAQFLWGVPKEGQSLREVEKLLLEQVELVKQGQFEEWLIPAIVTDFKKSYQRKLEDNGARVGILRDAFVARERWEHARRKLERMARVRKHDVVGVARRYFSAPYVVAYRLDGKPEVPPIKKPHLDVLPIEGSRWSRFAQSILAMPYRPIEPRFVTAGRDFEETPVRDGVVLYYAHNPLNQLFSFSVAVDVGSWNDNRLPIAGKLLDKCGTPNLAPAELKKEWYRLGTDFTTGGGDQQSTVTVAGLDENFAASTALMSELLHHPSADPSVLEQLKKIIIENRADARKDGRTIHQALYMFHRFGEDSYYRRMLPDAGVEALTFEDLQALLTTLPKYSQRWFYVGPRPRREVERVLLQTWKPDAQLREPPPHHVMRLRHPDHTEIYFFDKEMAQALVRLDFGDVHYQPPLAPSIQLFNQYFYGGMSGIVFQQLREARALAYSAWAWYFTAGRKEDYNMMSAFIGTQADKTADAVEAFVDLIDHMPVSPERFEGARKALITRYRTQRIGFRDILGAVRTWELQGLEPDPRARIYQAIQSASMDTMLAFYRRHVQNHAKLISVVGDRKRIDMKQLQRNGSLREVDLHDIFAF